MAIIRTEGINELIDDLGRSGESAGEVAEKMCVEAGKICVKSWKESISKHGHVDTGSMERSVKNTSVKKDGSSLKIDTYASSSDSKGVSNTLKSAVLHFGRNGHQVWRGKNKGKRMGSIIGSYFVDDANDSASEELDKKLPDMWDEHLNNHNL